MKALIITTGLFILASSLQSCFKCKGDNINQGIIVETFSNRCNLGPSGIVIDSRLEADSIFQRYDQCEVDSSFDFNNYTILACETSGSCNMKTVRTVERNDQLQRYIYHIQVEDCGCFNKRLYVDHNAVVVPKLPAGYTVEFIITGQK